jgi:hypothetical protein
MHNSFVIHMFPNVKHKAEQIAFQNQQKKQLTFHRKNMKNEFSH